MDDGGAYIARAFVFECRGGFDERTTRRNNVVNNDDVFVFHLTNNVQDFGLLTAPAAFIYNSQWRTEQFGISARHFYAADIGGDNNEIFEIFQSEVFTQNVNGVEVVNGNVKETLDLIGVQVQG